MIRGPNYDLYPIGFRSEMYDNLEPIVFINSWNSHSILWKFYV
jgi:hypothetical protein